MGLEGTKLIHRIIIHRDDPSTIWVGALGSAWGNSDSRGLYRTNDSGESWEKVLYVNDRTGVADMVNDPQHPEKLMVAMWEFGRTPWDFTSGGEGSGLHITYDGGENWEKIESENGLPKGKLGRMGLAVAASKPNIVYALIEAEKKNGLFRSDDGGHNWRKVASENIGNRPFYYSDIFVDPKNENRIYNLYSLVSRSEDGGRTFRTLLPYSAGGVHPDHHAFWISRDDPDYLIDGNDGGLNISRDGGKTWHFINNLPLGQFYHINYDMDFPYHVYGGMQDNGSWIGPGYILKSGGIRNYDWQELYFGDGFDVVPQPSDSRFGYAMSQGGNVAYYDRITGATQFIKPVHPEGVKLRFNWNAAIAQDPFNDSGIYFGSQFIHYSNDHGNSWAILSPDLTTNDSTKQQQAKSGGLTIDATNAENHTTLLCIAPSTHNKNVIWAGSDDGRLHITRNRGEQWTDLSSRLPGYIAGSWIPQIELSPHAEGEAFVVVNDYRRNNWEPYLYHTRDFGETWTRIIEKGDVKGHVISVVQDDVVPSLIFAGTDQGLYFSIDYGKTWQQWTAGYPSVSTRDMKIHPREHDLILGTFGRAIYILDDIRFLRELSRSKGEVLDSTIMLYPVPDVYQVSYRSYQGIRFEADADFVGENKRLGIATLTIWVKPHQNEETSDQPQIDKKGKKKSHKSVDKTVQSTSAKRESKGGMKKEDKAGFIVLDMDRDTVRTFSRKLKEGFNRTYWGLETNGYRRPSRRDARPGSDPPGGPGVLPGKYLVKVNYQDKSDSVWVTVKSDPRVEVSMEDLEERRNARIAFDLEMNKAAKAFDLLKEAKKQMEIIGKGAKNWPDSVKKEHKKMSRHTNGAIDSLMAVFMLPEGLKNGYHDSSNTLNSKIGSARRYLASGKGPLGKNALVIRDQVLEEINKTVNSVNEFIEGDWAKFRQWVDDQGWSPLKTLKPIGDE
jgi:photosystem II stability/assembly factor-like uncharacterized protein